MADFGFGVSPPEVTVLAVGGIICADFDGRCEGGEEEDGGAHIPAAPAAAPFMAENSKPAGPTETGTALYDYEAAEDNELSFPDGAKITNLVSHPMDTDSDWLFVSCVARVSDLNEKF